MLSAEHARSSVGHVYKHTDASMWYPLSQTASLCFPVWLSPNVMALLGMSFSLLNVAWLGFFSSFFFGPLAVPRDLPWFVLALSSVLVVCNLVAVDSRHGIQSSNCTTELFVRCSDAVTVLLLSVSTCAVLGLETPHMGPLLVWAALTLYQFSLSSNSALFGNSLVVVALMFVATSILGPSWWRFRINFWLFALPFGHVVVWLLVVLAVARSFVLIFLAFSRRFSRHSTGEFEALVCWASWSLVLFFWNISGSLVWRTCPRLCLFAVGLQFLVAVVFLVAARVSVSVVRSSVCLAYQMPAVAPLVASLTLDFEDQVLVLMWFAVPAMMVSFAFVFVSLLDSLCTAMELPHFWSSKGKHILDAHII